MSSDAGTVVASTATGVDSAINGSYRWKCGSRAPSAATPRARAPMPRAVGHGVLAAARSGFPRVHTIEADGGEERGDLRPWGAPMRRSRAISSVVLLTSG